MVDIHSFNFVCTLLLAEIGFFARTCGDHTAPPPDGNRIDSARQIETECRLAAFCSHSKV